MTTATAGKTDRTMGTAAQLPAKAARRRRAAPASAQDRREEILDAAKACFLEVGYEATKMADIARRAGLAHGTFYFYFPTKLAAFLALTERMTAAIYDAAATAVHPRHDVAAAIDEMIDAAFAAASEHRDVLAFVRRGPEFVETREQTWSLNSTFYTRFVEFLEDAQRKGAIKTKVSAYIATSMMIAAVDEGIQIAFVRSGKLPLEQVLNDTKNFAKQALGV